MTQTASKQVLEIGRRARAAAHELATVSGESRQRAIAAMPDKLTAVREQLQRANEADLADARSAGLAEPMLKRLEISPKVFEYMRDRLAEVAALPDPVGRVLEGQVRPNGLQVEKVSVPIGVIGIIYESRPNVTTDAAAVCLKSANAVILRGGSESIRTNIVLADAMIAALGENGLPTDSIQIVRTTNRSAVGDLLKLDKYVDVIIPRGGKGLIERVTRDSLIPVIKHYEGICHQYLAPDADEDMAISLVINSKCQRVEVCNALETVLVDQASADRLLPGLADALTRNGVEIRGCERTCELVDVAVPATEGDWGTEYLASIVSIRIVDDQAQAMAHIRTYGSGHTDGIVCQSLARAQDFVAGVDSASVLVNASTRLSGGGDYGLGAVVGISTDKLHARGPVGPDELTSYKWVVYGSGHIRS